MVAMFICTYINAFSKQRLHIGSTSNAENLSILKSLGITYVINCGAESISSMKERQIKDLYNSPKSTVILVFRIAINSITASTRNIGITIKWTILLYSNYNETWFLKLNLIKKISVYYYTSIGAL